MGLRDLFRRAHPLPSDAKARLDAAAAVVDEFSHTIDEALDLEPALGSGLHGLIAHRINWIARCRDNLQKAEHAFREGRTADAEEYLRRATSKAREGSADLRREIERVPPSSREP